MRMMRVDIISPLRSLLRHAAASLRLMPRMRQSISSGPPLLHVHKVLAYPIPGSYAPCIFPLNTPKAIRLLMPFVFFYIMNAFLVLAVKSRLIAGIYLKWLFL
jgi:hypothetical protein